MNHGLFGFPTQPAPSQSKIFTYLTSGTFTIPENYSRIEIFAQGGGSGGMSGNLNSTGDIGGGCGGRAGNLGYATFYATQLQTNTLYITIGAGGAGGAARTTNGVGNSSSSGGDTIVSTGIFNLVVGGYATASSNVGSAPPTSARVYPAGLNGGQAGARNNTAPYSPNGGSSTIPFITGTIPVMFMPGACGGAGGGSGVTPTGSHTNGGDSPASTDATRSSSSGNMGAITASLGGQTAGANGENGKPRFGLFGATGGGGGAGNNTGTGNGGNGGHGIYGSGGGAGGGALAGTGVSSGAGGNGGSGFVVIVVYY